MDTAFPYPSRRMPVLARNVVATSQPLAAQAGLAILRDGGNAVDAALATAIALTVVEPTSNGIGSDAFALIWDGSSLRGFNGSGRAPAAWTPDRFRRLESMPTMGWESVTVPGAVDAWVRLSERFGKLPFERLFRDAIRYAEDGFLVSPITAAAWAKGVERLKGRCDFRHAFALDDHRGPDPGELFRHPEQADTLRAIAETKGQAFYRGDLAHKMLLHSDSEGGAMTADDLASHAGEWVEPLSCSFDAADLHELPPNGQGIVALVALGVLRNTDLRVHAADSPEAIHLQVEAIKLAFEVGFREVADPSAMAVTPQSLLDEEALRSLAATIEPGRAIPRALKPRVDYGTVYLCAGDASGMMVSFIQSNYMGFGSGVVVPRTGISLQNRGAGFVLTPGHPNQVGGGKRPYQTIIPAFATRDGKPHLAFGVMGGHMQPQGHLQVFLRRQLWGQNPQAALDAPRWQVDETGKVLHLEAGFDAACAARLAEWGHAIAPGGAPGLFGGGQVIERLPIGYAAGSDPRKDGCALGF